MAAPLSAIFPLLLFLFCRTSILYSRCEVVSRAMKRVEVRRSGSGVDGQPIPFDGNV